MTLNEHELKPIQKLLFEVERKLMLAQTSLHASTEKGKQTISTRRVQIDVLKALLQEQRS